MEIECEEAVESRSPATAPRETSNGNDEMTKAESEADQAQPTKDFRNPTSTETLSEFSESSELDLPASSQSGVLSDTLPERLVSLAISEQTRDAGSADSICVYKYDWSAAPRLLRVATKEYQSANTRENFTKGCQWSPDGTCLLVPSEDFGIRIYELPRELYSGQVPSDFVQNDFASALMVKEGGLVYDTCWYPFMNSWDPATCCFLSTSRESPVHMWDAFTGELRATYRAYNQVDEVEAAISVQFVQSGREIWCGFKNAVRTFDTDRPGRQTYDIQFKHDFPNMMGLVSCIRENPIMSGLVAFGTYSKCIGLYKDGPLCTFKTGSGVTQIEFSPCGMKLFSAVRKNSEFLCWDLRKPGNVLYSLEGRQSDTNQRIQFAFTFDSKQIISGGVDGNIIVWELPETTNEEDLNPKYKIRLSKDCINGISLHPSLPIIATSSGQSFSVKGTLGIEEEAMTEACDSAMPRAIYTARKNAYWWTEEIAELRRSAIRARRALQRARRKAGSSGAYLEELKEIHRERRAELKAAIKKSKEKAWEEMIWSKIIMQQENILL